MAPCRAAGGFRPGSDWTHIGLRLSSDWTQIKLRLGSNWAQIGFVVRTDSAQFGFSRSLRIFYRKQQTCVVRHHPLSRSMTTCANVAKTTLLPGVRKEEEQHVKKKKRSEGPSSSSSSSSSCPDGSSNHCMIQS